MTRPINLQIREESSHWLTEHAQISTAFTVDCALDLVTRDGGLGGLQLVERPVASPYLKNYDAILGCHPAEWGRQCDLSNWGFISARIDGRPVGGAVIAFRSPGFETLEGRAELAVLWDIRVSPEVRRCGIAARLEAAVERWACDRRCRQLKVETQNVNVPACKFYASRGFELGAINRFAYLELPDESQLLWYKRLPASSGGALDLKGDREAPPRHNSRPEPVNVRQKLALFTEYWSPKIVGELNGQQVKLVKLRGEFIWHRHDNEDELFLVVKGRFRMEFRDRHVWLEEGEFLIVPRGVEHRPAAEDEVHVMLFEPASTLNTGNVQSEWTVARPDRL
ncbi:MAG TPA: GNAT family N-acetyltransferase [Pirellulales bacterium]|jgi:mannose-6-phosphate isomerase-like protein (cupin superfamily)/GNAT superfamily N-acetyltransferase|nr:GNAT family N-acetyltransferase [Pirellulales bacterium]